MSDLEPIKNATEDNQDVPSMNMIQTMNDNNMLSKYDYYEDADTRNWVSIPFILLLGLVVFVSWAAFFEIDQSVRTTGQFIPSARTQIIQAADGGVLSELLVHEGQEVVAGEVLAILEKERVSATYEESRSRVASLNAALIRAKAEILGITPSFGPDFDEYPEFVNIQKRLYAQRRQSLNDQLYTFRQGLDLAEEELRMNEVLLSSGDASQLEVMRARRQVGELKGQISAAKNEYLQESNREASELEAELDISRYQLDERKSMLDHTEIVAPVKGIIKYLKINTLGGVLRPGDELMQISPTESEMVVEVKIVPQDIGQLTLGLPVSVKLDAFDYSTYGSLDGILTYLSSDTLVEQSGERSNVYYRAQIKLNKDYREANQKLAHIALIPGLTTTVDIKTSTRSVLKYIAKPIVRAFSGALNER